MMTCRSSPISPARIASRTAAKDGSKRRLKPIWIGTSNGPISCQQASTLPMSRSIGFSHRMALPALAAAVISSTWVSVDDAIRTASTVLSSSASSTAAATIAPCRSATSSADGRCTS